MKDLIIIGAGGFGREARQLVTTLGGWRLRGFLDDDPALAGVTIAGVPILGTIETAAAHPDATFVVTIGNPQRYGIRREIVEELGLPDARYATLVHPSVEASGDSKIGAGSVLLAGCVLTAAVEVGRHVVVMPNVVLTHDDRIGDFATLGSGVLLAGGVTVGEGAYVGAGATVREYVRIGSGARIGMGSVVTRDVPAGETWMGVPARPA